MSEQPDPYAALSDLDIFLRKLGVFVGYLTMVAAVVVLVAWSVGAKVL